MEVKIVDKSCIYERVATGVVTIVEGQVLLVSSLKGPYLVLPKGGLESGLTPEQNAEKEALEEAGAVVVCYQKVFDDILHYTGEGFPEKYQREIYFLAEYYGDADVWDEADIRTVGFYPIIGGELESLMSPIQYEIVLKAYRMIAGVQYDHSY